MNSKPKDKEDLIKGFQKLIDLFFITKDDNLTEDQQREIGMLTLFRHHVDQFSMLPALLIVGTA